MHLTPSVLGSSPGAWEHEGFGHLEGSTFFPGLIPCICLFIHNPGVLLLPVRYAVVTIISLYVLNTSCSMQAVLSALPASFLCSKPCFPDKRSSFPPQFTSFSPYSSFKLQLKRPFLGETLPLSLRGFSFLTATLGAALYLHEGLCLISFPCSLDGELSGPWTHLLWNHCIPAI